MGKVHGGFVQVAVMVKSSKTNGKTASTAVKALCTFYPNKRTWELTEREGCYSWGVVVQEFKRTTHC